MGPSDCENHSQTFGRQGLRLDHTRREWIRLSTGAMRLSTLRSAADTLLTNTVEGATGPLLAHMVEQVSLSEDDLESLQKLIDTKKQSLKRSRRAGRTTADGRKRR